MYIRKNKRRKSEISFEDILKSDEEGSSMNLEDVLGTDKNALSDNIINKENKENLIRYLEDFPDRDKQIMIILYLFSIQERNKIHLNYECI